ncbi:MAG: hypothetical protein ACOCRK_00935 [bacterium]
MKYADKLMKIIFSYLGIFLLGAYSASQFVFDDPVSPMRWIVTMLITILFIIKSYSK